MGPWPPDPASGNLGSQLPRSLTSETAGKSSQMAFLTREDLRAELLRAPLLTEASVRSALREELKGLSALVQQALRPEARKVQGEWSQLSRFDSRFDSQRRRSDASDLSSNDRRSRSKPTSAARLVDTTANHWNSEGSIHSLQHVTEVQIHSDEELYVSEVTSPVSETQRQRDRRSEGSESTTVESLRVPVTPQADPPSMFLPGEIAEPKKGEQLREAGRDITPVEKFSPRTPSKEEGRSSSIVRKSSSFLAVPTSGLPDEHVKSDSDDDDDKKSNGLDRDFKTMSRVIMSQKYMHKSRTSERPLNVGDPSSSQVTLNVHCKERAWAVVNHPIFDYVVAAFILANGVVVGVQTDYLAQKLSDDAPSIFQGLEIIFCVLFTAELCLRLVAYRLAFFTQAGLGWNLFDLFVVTAQIFEIFWSIIASGLGFSFRLLRVLRLIRVIRLARALRLIGELRTIVSSITNSMKPLFWTGVLLFMVVYVLGVYTTQVVLTRRITYREDNEIAPSALELYWGTLFKSILTLFQSITGGVDWDQVARPLVEHVSPEMGVLFIAYIGFTVFCMLNVITGVFIESVMENAQKEQELRSMTHITQLFSKLDVDHTGEITWEDFEKNLERKEMLDFFKTIDVDIDNAHALFDLLDVDGSGSVDAHEFMDGCLRIWSPTKGLDLRMILRDVNKVLSILAEGRPDKVDDKWSINIVPPRRSLESMGYNP